jgi:hypothetical protein
MRVVNAKNLAACFQTRQAYEEAICRTACTARSSPPCATPILPRAYGDRGRAARWAPVGMIGPLGWSRPVTPVGQTAVDAAQSVDSYCQTLLAGRTLDGSGQVYYTLDGRSPTASS